MRGPACDARVLGGCRDLFTILQMMVGSNISDEQLRQIVDTTIAEAFIPGEPPGVITRQEFEKVAVTRWHAPGRRPMRC